MAILSRLSRNIYRYRWRKTWLVYVNSWDKCQCPLLTLNTNVPFDNKVNEYMPELYILFARVWQTKEWIIFEIIWNQGILDKNLNSLLSLKNWPVEPRALQIVAFGKCVKSNHQILQGEKDCLSVIPVWNEASPNLVKAFKASAKVIDAFSYH